jgi:hypothetical protein
MVQAMTSGDSGRRPTYAEAQDIARRLLPTPTVNGDHNRPYPGTSSGYGLATALKMLPTLTEAWSQLTVLQGYETRCEGTVPIPTARDWRSEKASPETHGRNSRPLNETLSAMSDNRSGRMNPRFREWMMGFPIGWTELRPQVTASFRKSRK